jgi:integrase
MKQRDRYVFPERYRDVAEDFVAYKQSLGFKYGCHEQEKINAILDYIYRYSKSDPVLALTPGFVDSFAAMRGNESPRTTHARQSMIRQFAMFLNIRGVNAYVYSRQLIKTTKDFIPYIFSKDELSALFRAADAIGPNKNKFVNTPYIYPAIFRTLYGCGMRVGETVSLLRSDVDMDNGVITIRNGKNGASRLLPLSKSLLRYLLIYDRRVIRCDNPYFFPALHDEHYSATTIRNMFIRLSKEAGIDILPSGLYPRVHDLRHTFAVHSLEQMIAKGMDPYCSLPALSIYLGHKGIESTEIYLRLTRHYFVDVLKYSAVDADRIFPEVDPL